MCIRDRYINFVNDLVRQVQAGINTRIPPVLSLSRGLENPVYQMVPCCREEKAEKILSALPGCRGVKWHDGLAVDVLPKNGAKERGISHVLSSYGIAREECAAIGDGYNDISMIRWAGTGIAMKNGKEETRRWADYITGSVMEDGIHQAIVYLLGSCLLYTSWGLPSSWHSPQSAGGWPADILGPLPGR